MFGNSKRKQTAIVYFSIILTTVIAITLKSEDMTFCKFSYNRNKIVRATFLMSNPKCLTIMLSIDPFDIHVCTHFKWATYVLN